MDTERLRRGLSISFRSVVTREWRLFAGMVLAVVGYVIWVGLTGAAISQLAAFANVSTAVDPWTGQTTGLTAVVLLLWVVLPAAAAVLLVVRETTNVHDNIEKYYRISPTLLLVPPLALLVVCAGVLAVVGPESRPALAVAVVAAVFFQIRTLIYSYRVFAFSAPRLTQAALFVTAAVVLLALLVEGAIALGRDSFVEDAAAGFGELIGVGTTDLLGTTTVAGLSVPALPGAAIAVPAGFSVGYVCLQALVGLVVRLRGKEVPRSKLRTGQRYPEFARPTTDHRAGSTSAAGATGSGASSPGGAQATTSDAGAPSRGPTASAQSDAGGPGDAVAPDRDGSSATATDDDATAAGEAAGGDETTTDDEASDDSEEVTHPRVFTPDATADQTELVGDGDSDDECPYCEADLAPGADSCHNCGASL